MSEDVPATAPSGRRTGELLGGRYRLGPRLGEGGFGVVYEATDEVAGGRVAVKLLHERLADVPEAVARFKREAAVITAIRHPNVVAILDTGATADGTSYLVMELLEGRSLSSMLAKEGALPIGRACHIAVDVCDALHAVHEAGIVHRDLKPDNVYLVPKASGGDGVKLLDFGVSKVRDPAIATSLATQTGTTLGTPYYMAPEQAQGKKTVDHRADVYSLGVILFRMLTGQHPFEDDSYPMLVLKVCTEPDPLVSVFRADVPNEIVALVHAMLAKEPSQRPSSCVEVKAHLLPYLDILDAPRMLDAPSTRRATPSALDGRIDSPLAHAPTVTPSSQFPRKAPEPEEPEAEEVDDALIRKRHGLPVWIFVAIVLLVGAVSAWLWPRARSPHAPRGREDEVTLPAPRPPVQVVLPARVDDESGWRFVNPLPRAMPTWNDVDVGGRGLVAMAGRDGAVATYVAGRLARVRTEASATFHAIAWLGPREVLAAGEHGTLRLLATDGPHPIDTGTDATLRAIAVVSPTEAIVVGDHGTFLRVVGSRATPVDVGTTDDLLGAFVRDGTVFAVGEGGVVLRFHDGRVEWEPSSVQSTLHAIGGCADGDLYAVGDLGVVLRRDREGHWSRVRTAGQEPFSDVACADEHVVVTGLRGGVLLVQGERWARLDTGDARPLLGVAAAPGEVAWAVGAGGRLLHVLDDHVEVLTGGSTKALFDVASLAGRLVAVGVDGTLLRQTDRGLEEREHVTDAGLAALAPIAEDRLLAVGDTGVLVEIRYDGARIVPSGIEGSLRDVVASPDGWIVAVGANGTILRGREGAFVATTVDGVGTLWSIAGTPDDAWAVGDGGAVVRVSSEGARRIACERSERLRGAFVAADGTALAVGDRGLVVRLAETGCSVEHEGGGDLAAVDYDADGHVWAVGVGGHAITRADDGHWSATELDAGGYDLHGITLTDRDVYVVGAGGVVLRHARMVVPARR